MHQRPRKLTEFDIRATRVFIFLCGLGLIGYSGRELALDPDLTNAANWVFLLVMACGAWCLYAVFSAKVKRLEHVDFLDGGGVGLLWVLMLVIAIVSFVIASFLPERKEQ